MTIVALIIAAVIILVVAALILQVIKRPSSPKPKAKPAAKTVTAPPPASPEKEIPSPEPPVTSMIGYNESIGMFKDLRTHLTKGIEKVFSENVPAAEERPLPRTREQVNPKVLKEALGYLEGMDQFRTRQFELQKLLNDPRSQLTELSKIITADPLLTTKVLKMANSPYFGLTQKIDSIGHALMILGLQNVKNIMYREGLRGMFDTGPVQNKNEVAKLWRHCNLVCICAQHFHDLFEGLNRGTLFTLGIVHDIGKLMLMNISRKAGQKTATDEEYPLDILIGEEDQLFGINHAVLGGITLENWNFSELMTQAVIMHHTPSFIEAGDNRISPEILKYVLALFLADQVAKLFADWNEGTINVYPLQKSYHDLIDKKKLLNKIIDVNFLNQLQAAEMLAGSEHPLPYPKGPGRQPQ